MSTVTKKLLIETEIMVIKIEVAETLTMDQTVILARLEIPTAKWVPAGSNSGIKNYDDGDNHTSNFERGVELEVQNRISEETQKIKVACIYKFYHVQKVSSIVNIINVHNIRSYSIDNPLKWSPVTYAAAVTQITSKGPRIRKTGSRKTMVSEIFYKHRRMLSFY